MPPPIAAWIAEVHAGDKHALLAAFSRAAKRFGKSPIAVADRGTWGMDELARAALVHALYPKLSPQELWAHGDNRERQAVLRVLPDLPAPGEHVALAVEACRSNVLTVFEAIACENPFPAAHFSELQWNQMVLKAAFNGVALARIRGLPERRNAELARMARDFAAERRAAGRPVPADLDLAIQGAAP